MYRFSGDEVFNQLNTACNASETRVACSFLAAVETTDWKMAWPQWWRQQVSEECDGAGRQHLGSPAHVGSWLIQKCAKMYNVGGTESKSNQPPEPALTYHSKQTQSELCIHLRLRVSFMRITPLYSTEAGTWQKHGGLCGSPHSLCALMKTHSASKSHEFSDIRPLIC